MTSGPDTGGGTVEIGPIGPEQFERWHDLRRQAFGATNPFDADLYSRIPAERILGAFVDGVLSASTVIHPYLQTWGGVGIPCGGVSGVVVAPEARGRGLARTLVGEHLSDMSRRGEVISALYPTTASLYRSLGFDIAGSYTTRSIPSFSVPTEPATHLVWDRVEFDDRRISAVETSTARARTGRIDRDRDIWGRIAAHWRGEPSVNRFAYVGRRDSTDVATVVYRYSEPEDPEFGVFYVIETDVIAASDADSWRSVLAFLAMQSTTSAEIRTDLHESLLVSLLPQPQRARVRQSVPWMLRLVDVVGAVEARPVPAAVNGSVALHISDDSLAANAGPWTLEVAQGRGTLVSGGPGTVALTVQTLARVYAGADVHSLAGAGLLPGATDAAIDLLAATFVSTPDLQFFF